MKKEESKAKKIIAIILMLLITDAVVGGMAFLRGKAIRDILFIVLLTTAGVGCTSFSLFQAAVKNALHKDNSNHFFRFSIIFNICMICGCAFVLIPYTAWVFPALALFLALFSGTVPGLVGYQIILSICVYFSGQSSLIFIMYSFMGILFIILYEKMDNDFSIGAPLLILLIVYSVVLAADVVFKNRGVIDLEEFLIPIINVAITMIITLAVLKFYCSSVLDKDRNRYIVINDQEFELLAKYKQENPEMYFNAIHTAYFADKFARIIGLDVDVVKNGGYYHKIILNECKINNKSLDEVCKEYDFPESAYNLLHEYCYRSQNLLLKESVTVYLADAVVTSLLYVLSKEENKNKKIDYGQVAAAIIKRKVDSGELNQSEFTLKDKAEMEKMFRGEKLYYDFLRRE